MASQYSIAFDDTAGDGDLSSIGTLPGRTQSNALSNKIISVLSASYADSEIRNALGLLDARGTTNTTETRRNMRLDAQKEVIDCNVAILDEFGHVAEQLKRVGAMITTLNNTCDQMRKHIAMAKSDSAPMLEEASAMVASKQESETKQAVLSAFTKHFIVANEDLDILTSSAIPVNDQFFIVLERVKKIHKDCEPLLGSENERLGLELMEQTSRNLDAGFKKLYNWVQRALKVLDFEDPQISGSIRHSLRILSERPNLFQNCLQFLAEAREQTLSDAFQSALSGVGEASGTAIEFSAHDILRYMGDMLAWVHSTTVSEKESFEGLFIADAEVISESMKSGRTNEPWLQDYNPAGISEDNTTEQSNASFDGENALKDLVSRSLSTISATLRERIELAIHQHDDIVLLFKAQNLLTFYHELFTKLIGEDSALSTTVQRLEGTARDHIYQVLASDTDNSWVSDPIEGPIHHKENLSTLAALFAIRAPDEMATEQIQHFMHHYHGPTKEYAEIVAAATNGDYDEEHIVLAIEYITGHINVILKEKVAGDAYMNIMKAHDHRVLLHTLKDTLVGRIYLEMMAVSGVADLLQQEVTETLLPKLPDYTSQLSNFLSFGYADIVGRLKKVDTLLLQAEEVDKEESVAVFARDMFVLQLGKVFEALEGQGAEYREGYPRTMKEVEELICD